MWNECSFVTAPSSCTCKHLREQVERRCMHTQFSAVHCSRRPNDGNSCFLGHSMKQLRGMDVSATGLMLLSQAFGQMLQIGCGLALTTEVANELLNVSLCVSPHCGLRIGFQRSASQLNCDIYWRCLLLLWLQISEINIGRSLAWQLWLCTSAKLGVRRKFLPWRPEKATDWPVKQRPVATNYPPSCPSNKG